MAEFMFALSGTVLLPLITFHPLVQPLAADQLPAAHRNMREAGYPVDFACEDMRDMGL
jgi:hypothetical protein